jgi:uncharacterized protein
LLVNVRHTWLDCFFLGWFLVWLPIGLVVARLGRIRLTYPVAPEHKLPLLLPLYLVAPLAVEVYRRYWDNAAWFDYGVFWHGQFMAAAGLGFAIATLGVTLLIGVQLALGWRQWRPPADPNRPPPPLALLLALLPLTLLIGWVEELIFRGVLVNGLLAALPWAAMALVASLIFAISHLVWDGPAGIPQLPGLGLMGLVLIVARWAAGGSLGLAWGLHAGWIFAIALSDALALTGPSSTAPDWLAGKPDQPLTGVAALGLLFLTGVGIWGYAQWAGARVGWG